MGRQREPTVKMFSVSVFFLCLSKNITLALKVGDMHDMLKNIDGETDSDMGKIPPFNTHIYTKIFHLGTRFSLPTLLVFYDLLLYSSFFNVPTSYSTIHLYCSAMSPQQVWTVQLQVQLYHV